MSFDMNPADEDEHGECRHEIEHLRKVVAAFRAQVRFPIGQGRDDCNLCYGIGLVGTDGTACECVRMK